MDYFLCHFSTQVLLKILFVLKNLLTYKTYIEVI